MIVSADNNQKIDPDLDMVVLLKNDLLRFTFDLSKLVNQIKNPELKLHFAQEVMKLWRIFD